MRHQSVMKIRKICAVGVVGGAMVCAAGVLLMFATGRGPQSKPPGIAAMIGVVMAMVAGLAGLLTSRCPFCRKWVHPMYYPRRGVHCPLCGKTAGT